MAGAKKKYTTDYLKGIVDNYFKQPFMHGQASPSDIAKYAREKLGYTQIIYQHFTRDKDVVDYLEDINNSILKGSMDEKVIYLEFNPDVVMKVHGNNLAKLMPILWRFADDFRKLNQENLDLQNAEIEYKKQINELTQKNNVLKDKYKTLKNQAERNISEVRRLNKFKKLDDELKMREYLAKQTVTKDLSEENVKMILKTIGFADKNTSYNKDLEPKEGDASVIDKDNVDEDSITGMNNKKISNFNDKKSNKDDEVERLLADIDDMI